MALVCCLAILASATDLERRILPNRLLGPMALAALAIQILRCLGGPWLTWMPWVAALDPQLEPPFVCVGEALGVVIALGAVEWGLRRARGAPQLGYGDIKLTGCWTLALGVGGPLSLGLGAATGGLWALAHGQRDLALGPWVCGWAVALAIGWALAT